MISSFLYGLILSFGLILPLGVQNVFIFNQSSVHTRVQDWLPIVVAASLCDTVLILLAVGGVSVAVLSISWLKTVLVGIGVLFLLYMGWLTWRTAAAPMALTDGTAWSRRRQIMFTVSVSWLNPHAILDTIGVIGVSSLAYNQTEKTAFTLACVLVSWIWFFSLALLGRTLRTIDTSGRILPLLNRVSAVIMLVSAVYLFNSL